MYLCKKKVRLTGYYYRN